MYPVTILNLANKIEKLFGFCWDNTNPRIQLEPIGTRGYIELHQVQSSYN